MIPVICHKKLKGGETKGGTGFWDDEFIKAGHLPGIPTTG